MIETSSQPPFYVISTNAAGEDDQQGTLYCDARDAIHLAMRLGTFVEASVYDSGGRWVATVKPDPLLPI